MISLPFSENAAEIFQLPEKNAFERKIDSVSTKYGDINVKLKMDSNEIIGIYPEYEDCKNLAKVHNIPLKVIFDEAVKQFNNLPR